jgi:thymidine phosphorylase
MLKIKHISINSLGENQAYINRNCAEYRIDEIDSLLRLEILGENKSVYAFLQKADDSLVAPDEIGLNDEAFKALNLPQGSMVSVIPASQPLSLRALEHKLNGEVLSSGEYAAIFEDIANGRYAKTDMAAFLVACGANMAATELVSMTETLMADRVLYWHTEKPLVNQYSFGGIPANKTDLIVMSIVAAYGLPVAMPCTHSRISVAGTADTTGCFAELDLSAKEFQKQIYSDGAAVVCYDALYHSESGRLLHNLRNRMEIKQNELIAASILAMMLSVGVCNFVLDIPVGKYARVNTANEAMRLKKQIEYVGDVLGISVDVVISDGSEPIGNGIGAVLEAQDVLKVLQNDPAAPRDLREKSLYLAGRVLEFDAKLRGGLGYDLANEILTDGRALKKFEQIREKQGKKSLPPLGDYVRDVVSSYDGVVESINTEVLSRIGTYAGATQSIGSGVYLHKKVGDKVKSGDIIYTVYSCNATDFDFVSSLIESNNGYNIVAE